MDEQRMDIKRIIEIGYLYCLFMLNPRHRKLTNSKTLCSFKFSYSLVPITVRVAGKPEQFGKLIESGFKHVCQRYTLILLRKRR
jgi:hypothetical protein